MARGVYQIAFRAYTPGDSSHGFQILEKRDGALSRRAGSITTAQTRARAPWTAMPTRRKGSNSSHTMGYRIRATRAMGQHRMKRKHQSRKAIMGQFLLNIIRVASGRSSGRRVAWARIFTTGGTEKHRGNEHRGTRWLVVQFNFRLSKESLRVHLSTLNPLWLRFKVFLEKLQAPESCVAPDFGLESVADTGVDFDFIPDSLLLQHLLRLVVSVGWHGRTGLPVQD